MTDSAKRGLIGIPVEGQIDDRNEGGRKLAANMAAAARQLTDAFGGGGMTEVGSKHYATVDESTEPATLDDLLPVVERIAEALEAQARPIACVEVHISGRKCVLDERHVGHHTTGDGRVHWLDDE